MLSTFTSNILETRKRSNLFNSGFMPYVSLDSTIFFKNFKLCFTPNHSLGYIESFHIQKESQLVLIELFSNI